MQYANLLKSLREKTGESQAQLAERMGWSVRTLQGWEVGRPPRVMLHRQQIEAELRAHGLLATK